MTKRWFHITRTASSIPTIEVVWDCADYKPFDYEKEGERIPILGRLKYALLILIGKRRSYPICGCAWGRDDE